MKNILLACLIAAAQASIFGDLLEEGYTTNHSEGLSYRVSNAGHGVDVSSPMSATSATCLKNNGYTTVIARAWTSLGSVDTAACGTLTNAKNAGILNRDVYMFPCVTCSASAATQLNNMVTYLKNNCPTSWSTMTWLDIEGY